MAYLTVNSQFTPYTFDELLKPFAIYDSAYKEQEALIDAAREKEFSSSLNPELDSVAYGMYNTASSRLKSVSDELAANGLSTDLRSRIRSTARDYKTTMGILNDAQQRLYAERDRRAKLGPDYVYQQEGLRIGDFLNGATPNQRGESLSSIAESVGKQFATRARSITDDTWNKVIVNGREAGYFDVESRAGLTANQLDRILSDDIAWNGIMNDNTISAEEKRNLSQFRNVISSTKNSIGFDKFDPDDQYKIQNAINLGATAGLQSVSHQYKNDDSYNPLGWANYNLNRDKFNAALAEEEDPYVHEAGKPVSRQSRVLNEDGSFKLKPGYAAGKSGGSTPTKSTSNSNRIPYIGVKHVNAKGEITSYGSDKEWNEAKGGAGTPVVRASDLEDYNKEILAYEVGLDPDDSAELILETAKRRGIAVSVINHRRESKRQELILRGSKTVITKNDETPNEEEDSFDVDG